MAVLVRARANRRWKLLLLALVQVCLVALYLSSSRVSDWIARNSSSSSRVAGFRDEEQSAILLRTAEVSLPLHSNLSLELRRRNALPARNRDLFPTLAPDHLIVVLYVHNRPDYFKLAVESLSRVHGMNETLLIISHDGFFPDMNRIAESIRFCRVKQLFAAFSPHLFPDSFPGSSARDCQGKKQQGHQDCEGEADQYGNFRSPRIVSLKHHWWWMMNTVWDGLPDTARYDRHILFLEEDHFALPNAYRNLQLLCAAKNSICPECWMSNLAPWDVRNRGEGGRQLVAEKIGNVGYAFNRTVWRKLQASAAAFCGYDDYNWDFTLWSAVYPSWGVMTYTLRGPRASAVHFGRCGLHQGSRAGQPACDAGQPVAPPVDPLDTAVSVDPSWPLRRHVYSGYPRGFTGWGGWGDPRDRRLCLEFASLYLRPGGQRG